MLTRILKPVTITDIENLLVDLGGRNHDDNMRELRPFPNFFLVELFESEFLDLVFLQNDETLAICPRGGIRTLRVVAQRALKLPIRKLSGNWDLDSIAARTKEHLGAPDNHLRPLVLRDAHQSEARYGPWYIQDGSHSALGYAMALLAGDAPYSPVRAYCATHGQLT